MNNTSVGRTRLLCRCVHYVIHETRFRNQRYRQSKTYFCNPWDIKGGVCSEEERGHFLFNLPDGLSLTNTSIWTTRLVFSSIKDRSLEWSEAALDVRDQVLYDQPVQIPLLAAPFDKFTMKPHPEIEYEDPVQYPVLKTGYYCVGASIYCNIPTTPWH